MSSVVAQRKVSSPETFGKVAVLMGGYSSEREVSLKSGQAVYQALLAQGVDAHAIDADENLLRVLMQGEFDRVFIVLHGEGGEDGTLQGALELMSLPYTGSGVLGSAIGMDKVKSKRLWAGLGLPTPAYMVVNGDVSADDVVAKLGLPLIVKPSSQGSSIGMAKVTELSQLEVALSDAEKYDDEVLIEQWVQGAEYTVAILADSALPLIKLETTHSFYDYEAKYISNDTRYICPCGLDDQVEKHYQAIALQAFNALGCSGWGRVDLMVDEAGNPWLLEANTVPGMTDHSLVPMAAKQAGLSFEQLVWAILEETVESKG